MHKLILMTSQSLSEVANVSTFDNIMKIIILKAAILCVSFEMSDILRTASQLDDQQDVYERKYYALKRKCEEVQQVKCLCSVSQSH